MRTSSSTELLELAENAFAHVAFGPSTERERRDAYTLICGPERIPQMASVQRLRLAGCDLDDVVAEARAWFAARDRAEFTWWVGESAEPAGLVDALVARGAWIDDSDAVGLAMVLDEEPPPADVEVAVVDSLERFAEAWGVFERSYGFPALDAEARALRWEARDPELVQFVAYDGGRAISVSNARRLGDGALYLAGAATLPEARGRGAYRALIRARWEYAQSFGIGTLVIQAGPMSAPIAERLGFQRVAEIRILHDRSGA